MDSFGSESLSLSELCWLTMAGRVPKLMLEQMQSPEADSIGTRVP